MLTSRQTIFYKNSLITRFKRSLGFTLAEVLITLTVIGVVAAMGIPAIIQSVQDMQTTTGVKAASAMMNEATTKLASDNGGTLKGLCNDRDDDCLMNLYKPYLSSVQSCALNASWGICRARPFYMDGVTPQSTNFATLVLTNGMIVEFRMNNKACDYTSPAQTTNSKCGWFSVDINGRKAPNVYGKDIFWFSLQENSIKPGGAPGDYNNFLNCTGSETGNWSGFGCTAKYIIK